MSGNTVDTLDPGIDIVERLGLSRLLFIYFGYSMLVLLSYKLSDGIDLNLFIFKTVSSISVI